MNNNINRMPYLYNNNYIYSTNKNNNKVFMNRLDVPVNRDEAFLEIFIFTERGQYGIPGASITIYVMQDNNLVPVYHLTSENYPMKVVLPVAHPLGTLIRGPMYYFTTYYITVEANNFAPCRVNNLRLFEGITTKFDINMFEIIPGQTPVPETIINIPPHPRDIVSG